MKAEKGKPILVKELQSIIKALKKLNSAQKTSILQTIDISKSLLDEDVK